jgi:hypothetical protein
MKKSVSAQLPGKIVNVCSDAEAFGTIDFDNLNLEKGAYWNPLQAYANTKLMVIFQLKFIYLIIKVFNYIYLIHFFFLKKKITIIRLL